MHTFDVYYVSVPRSWNMEEKEISFYLGHKLLLNTYDLKMIVLVYLVTFLKRSKTFIILK